MSWASQWGGHGDKFLVNIPATTLRISHILLKVFITKKFFGARITAYMIEAQEEDRIVRIGVRDHRVHTEWQWPFSNVHSIMMEKSAQPGAGGGDVRPSPFTIYITTYKVVVYAPAERADPYTLPYIWTLCSRVNCMPIGLVWISLNTHP